MPGAGTDKTKRWIEQPAPVVVLVEPQLGENIGAAARAMANFGLARLRLVKPKQGWPNERAAVMAAGADRILESTLSSTRPWRRPSPTAPSCSPRRRAITTRPSRWFPPSRRRRKWRRGSLRARRWRCVFGRERNGLENHEVGHGRPHRDAAGQSGVRLAQSGAGGGDRRLRMVQADRRRRTPCRAVASVRRRRPSSRSRPSSPILSASWRRSSFSVRRKNAASCRSTCATSFIASQPTKQDMRTLHGVIMALVQGSKGPARGGVLDPSQAQGLREMIAEQGAGRARRRAHAGARAGAAVAAQSDRGRAQPVAGDDRRPPLCRSGFKWQVPVGPHIADFVSFPLKCMIDLVPAHGGRAGATARAAQRAWMIEHNYRIVDIQAADVEADVKAALDDLAAKVRSPSAHSREGGNPE